MAAVDGERDGSFVCGAYVSLFSFSDLGDKSFFCLGGSVLEFGEVFVRSCSLRC